MWLPSVLVLSLLFFDTFALSTSPRPLKRIAHPETLSIEILPRPYLNVFNRRSLSPESLDLLHSDSFRLTLSAFGQTFYLHLRPNDHLLHPAARINYFSTTPDGRTVLTRTEPLVRDSVRAYYGDVVSAHHSSERLRLDAARVVPDARNRLGWARIVVHHQGDPNAGVPPVFEGAFTVDGIIHHISTSDNYLLNKQQLDPEIIDLTHSDAGLVIWRDSDVLPHHEEETLRLRYGLPPKVSPLERPASCGHDSLPYNTDPFENPVLRHPRSPSSWYDPFNVLDTYAASLNVTAFKRDDVAGNGMNSTNFVNNIGDGSGCPSSQKVVYMGVAADCTYTQRYGSQANATRQILNDWNLASALYKTTFKISLGLVELQIMDPNCPSSTDPAVPWNIDCGSVTLSDRLSLFSQWRGNKGVDGTGLWHLLSTCVTGSEVGIAWLATLCQTTAIGTSPNIVSGTGVSTAGRTEWQVIAHEIGHNFGAICTDGCTMSGACCPFNTSTCGPSSKFIMNPTTSETEAHFSPCSLGNICSLMKGVGGSQTNASCILDPDPTRQIISMQMCGNGIVEAGEECDPGLGNNSTCCDSQTCKFTVGAVCDPSSSTCCTNDCKLAPAMQLCRKSRDDRCDTSEFCTGNSSSCPADIMKPNGQGCGSGGLACAGGICTSLNLQCQSAGSTLGLTKACPAKNDRSCQVSCQDPRVAGQCTVLQTQLVDGSPCGYGGTCLNGNCQNGSFWDTLKAWYTENLQISVPVTVVAGLFIIIMVTCCFKVAFKRAKGSKSRRFSTEPGFARTRGERISSWPAENSIPGSISQGRRVLSRQTKDYGPGMAGIGANRAVLEDDEFRFNGSPVSHPPALQPRYHQRWVDDGIYNGPEYQTRH